MDFFKRKEVVSKDHSLPLARNFIFFFQVQQKIALHFFVELEKRKYFIAALGKNRLLRQLQQPKHQPAHQKYQKFETCHFSMGCLNLVLYLRLEDRCTGEALQGGHAVYFPTY
ncbi:MAG: hypothetical protein IPN20_01715 [Haliscomenobacter sp.]|nr:hypothetical protein [Haliscomenobacter sp.]MBP9875205.1 hypothetical protein [Haliscomenobacter sp.]